ncbi:MAG: hypothetical protein DSZ03_07660 [Sulfurimonas sp.]|nr:MAG: hypothetical protein DSZ03_07660 [Sulfurimonas sp.]
MKTAFTLLELIVVIAIIGIMAAIGSSSFRSHYLRDDVHFIVSKIQEAHFKGIGYEHNGFGIEESTPDYNHGCIELRKDALNNSALNTTPHYHLHVEDFDYGTLCFDAKGRPHHNNFQASTLLTTQKLLNFTYSGKSHSIIIEPVSGYAIIKQ